MSIVVAGGAGFIGSHLTRKLSQRENNILVIDNFSRGKREFLEGTDPNKVTIIEANLADDEETLKAITDYNKLLPVTEVWHMAANSDIPAGIKNARVDYNDTFMTTFNLLETMKHLKIPYFAFASSSAIYGDLGPETTLYEEIGPLLPISNYGAMKLASEAIISAAVESWLKQAWIFRFPNVVGSPATHGVILDFIHKLQNDPAKLHVLGNGKQQKAYLHVKNLVDAMLFIRANAVDNRNIYNIGPDDPAENPGCSVAAIAETVRSTVSPNAEIIYGSEDRGWVGDVPKFKYSIEKLRKLGWQNNESSQSAVKQAVQEVAAQEGVLC